jgi:hypothetical protein
MGAEISVPELREIVGLQEVVELLGLSESDLADLTGCIPIEEDAPSADERVSAGRCHLSFFMLSAWSRLPVGRTAAMSDKPVSGTPSRGNNGAAAGALVAGLVVLLSPR